MTELSRRAVAKLAAKKGLTISPNYIMRDGETVFLAPADVKQPLVWKAMLDFLAEYAEPVEMVTVQIGEDDNPNRIVTRVEKQALAGPHVGVDITKGPIHKDVRKGDLIGYMASVNAKPPTTGPFATSGQCSWPGQDNHGHDLCKTLPVGEHCACDCHKKEDTND